MTRAPESGRYTLRSDADLAYLHSGGPNGFIPEAWEDLNNEIQRRQGLETWEPDPQGRPPIPGRPEFAGWLGFFSTIMWLSAAVLTVKAMISVKRGEFPEAVVHLAIALTVAMGLQLQHRRRPLTPRYWRGLMVAAAILTYVEASLSTIDSGLRPNLFEILVAPAFMALPAVMWAVYWHRSRRVRETFSDRRDRSDAVTAEILASSRLDTE